MIIIYSELIFQIPTFSMKLFLMKAIPFSFSNLILILVFVIFVPNVSYAQTERTSNPHSPLQFGYKYGPEIAFISKDKAAPLRMIYGATKTEEIHFISHNLYIAKPVTNSGILGLKLTFGNRFYVNDEREQKLLSKNDFDFDNYFAVGAYYHKQLIKIHGKEQKTLFVLRNYVSLLYRQLNGFKQNGSKSSPSFSDITIREATLETGILAGLEFKSNQSKQSKLFIYAEPLSFKTGIYQIGFGYLRVGFNLPI